jgi:hypothetical protein
MPLRRGFGVSLKATSLVVLTIHEESSNNKKDYSRMGSDHEPYLPIFAMQKTNKVKNFCRGRRHFFGKCKNAVAFCVK